MAAASLAVRISAQIAEFQKAFAESSKTLDGFKSDFNTTSKNVQTSVDKMSTSLDSISSKITAFGKPFGAVGAAVTNTVNGLIKTFGSLGTAAGVIGAGLAGIGIAVGVAVAAFKILESAATAAFDFVKGAVTDTAALGEQLFDLSNKVGVSVESLSALKFVAAQTGTSLETISGAVFKMSTNLGTGSKKTTEAINSIGLSLADLKKQAPEEAFATILQSINKIPGASAQAAAGVAIFGKSFQSIAQLKGENLDEIIKKAKELGLVMSTETAVAADMLGDKMNELRGQLEGFRQEIGAKLIPVVLTFVEVFGTIFSEAFSSAIQTFQGAGKSFDTFVVQIGNAVARIIEIFALMLDGITTWATSTIVRTELVALAMVSLAESTLAAARAAAFLTGNFTVSAVFAALETKLTSIRQGLESMTEATLLGGTAIRRFATDVAAAAKGVDFGKAYQKVLADISEAADKMREKLAAIGVGAKEGADAAVKALETLLDRLTGKTILVEAIKWEAALKVVGKEFHRLTDKDAKEFLGVVDEITDRFGSLEAAGVGGLKNIATTLRALTSKGQTIELPIIPTMSTQTLAAVVAKAQPPQMILPIIPQMSDATLATIGVQISKARIDWAERARGFIDDLKQIGLEAAHGLAEALAQGIETGNWSHMGQALQDIFADVFSQVLAATVDFFVPGLGRALQPLFKALGRQILQWAGLDRTGREMVKAFAESFEGGFDGLREELRSLGAEGEALWVRLTQQVAAGSEEQAQAAIDAINAAFKKAEEGMKKFTDGAMQRIKAFAASFKTAAGETAAALRKLIDAEMPELEMGIDEANARKALAGFADAIGGSRAEIQAEFQRLGLYAGVAFSETLRDEGLAAALAVAGPMFDELNALSAEFGLTLEGSAAQFAEFFRVAKENEDVVSALDAITQMVQGAGDAAFLTHELFSAFSLDAVAQFEKLQQRGVDANSAMALMQPTLQALWEAQQKFGFETDAATQALIDQGVEQGIVGANMRDVNEKILDVLLAIAKVFKADIPAGLDATAQKSKQTADTMARDFDAAGRRAKDSLSGIKVPDIEVKVNYVTGDVETPEFPDVPAFAKGGIVRKPTLAVIGEKGPEAIIPLNQLGLNFGGQQAAPVSLDFDAMLKAAEIAAAEVERIFASIRPTLPDLGTITDPWSGEIRPPDVEPVVLPIEFDVSRPQLPDLGTIVNPWKGEMPPIEVPIELVTTNPIDLRKYFPGGILPTGLEHLQHIPGLQHGGIVRSPTLALVGEGGPEMVIPLSQMGSVAPQGSSTVILEVDGRALGEVVIPHLAAGVTRLGLGF